MLTVKALFMANEIFLILMLFAFATLYSSVGHAGASGYLAAMALMSVAAGVMKPSAVLLNVFVATIGTVRFARAGCLKWNQLWPFVVSSIPMSYLGGRFEIKDEMFKLLLGLVLLYPAIKLIWPRKEAEVEVATPPGLWWSLPVGGVIGFASGLTATGGGLFLTPILLLARWTTTREAAGLSVAFILCNSLSQLVARAKDLPNLPSTIVLWIIAVILGGLLGTDLGTRRLTPLWMKRFLGGILLFSAVKLIAEPLW